MSQQFYAIPSRHGYDFFVIHHKSALSSLKNPSAEMNSFCEASHIREVTMANFEVPATSDKYLQYAVEATEHAKRASTDFDRAAWILMANSWLNLLPLIDCPTMDSPKEPATARDLTKNEFTTD